MGRRRINYNGPKDAYGLTCDFIKNFDVFYDIIEENIEGATQAALKEGGKAMIKHIKRAMIAAFAQKNYQRPDVNHSPEEHIDKLTDAVMMSRIKKYDWMKKEAFVHTLGNHKRYGGTYRARFFNAGTQDRVITSYDGKQLKKPNYMGVIPQLSYFKQGVASSEEDYFRAVEQGLMKWVQRIFDKSGV